MQTWDFLEKSDKIKRFNLKFVDWYDKTDNFSEYKIEKLYFYFATKYL